MDFTNLVPVLQSHVSQFTGSWVGIASVTFTCFAFKFYLEHKNQQL